MTNIWEVWIYIPGTGPKASVYIVPMYPCTAECGPHLRKLKQVMIRKHKHTWKKKAGETNLRSWSTRNSPKVFLTACIKAKNNEYVESLPVSCCPTNVFMLD